MNIIRRVWSVMRKTGRTEKALVSFFCSDDAIFVVHTEHYAEELRRKYPSYRNRITSLGQAERITRLGRHLVIFDHTAIEFELDKLYSIIQEMRVTQRVVEDFIKNHYNIADVWYQNLTQHLAEARVYREQEKRNKEKRPQMARFLTDIEIFDALQDLYESEINFSIETAWNAGFYPSFGNHYEGMVGEECFDSFIEAARWLVDMAMQRYPDSTFTKKWKIPQYMYEIEEGSQS